MCADLISSILDSLRYDRPEKGWKAFLQAYAPRLMQVVRQYEEDVTRAEDCFMFVCEKLSDTGFRRLLQFDTSRGVPFQTWLASVVSNLCIDWHREEYGRKRPLSCITRLPELDQQVYRYKFESGMSLESCFRLLQTRFPGLTRDQLSETVCRIHSQLTPRQRWRLSFHQDRTSPADDNPMVDCCADYLELADPRPGPEVEAHNGRQRDVLLQALSGLPYEDRLLLRMRFQEDIPFREIARLNGLTDAFQARRRIDTALAALAELLPRQDD